MTPDEYARAKDVFARVVQLPQDERVGFVRQQCHDDEAILEEVLSLLSHHQELTILESRKQLPASNTIVAAPPSKIDSYLVRNEVWEENREILRRRVLAVAYVLLLLEAISMVRFFTYHYATVGFGVRAAAITVCLTCIWILYRNTNLSLRQIRTAEGLLMASVGMLAIAIYTRLMMDAASRHDEVSLISAHNWNYFIWALIIFVYGVFMPNTWQRAAYVLLPMAMIPPLVTVLADAINPEVGVLLDADDLGMPIPAPIVAAGVAIYAAHSIHGARLSALHARRLAQYKITRLIGEGGMGQVFEAEHVLLKRPCAIKTIRPEACSDSHALNRFEREVRATAWLTHPHTIEVYDYGQTKDDVFFFAMELLPGMSLRELVKVFGPLPPARALHFLIQTCEALQEAHGADLIHRDIKPGNIFASQRGGIYDFTKLLDFGLVREMKVSGNVSLTSSFIAGTPGYMSPEQVTSPNEIDARSDLFSVGAVAYFLLTGRSPFDGKTPMEVVLAQINETPANPSTIQSNIPMDLDAIVMRCLAKNPDERTPTAKQLCDELRKCGCANGWTQEDASQWWQTNGMS